MFLLSWIGMRAMPPNPQTKMMSYMMPVMFTVMFLNFASGLNLYYAVQNIAALPQQWILTRERAKAGVVASTAPAAASVKAEAGERRSWLGRADCCTRRRERADTATSDQ